MPTLRQQDISKLVFVKEFQINCRISSYSQRIILGAIATLKTPVSVLLIWCGEISDFPPGDTRSNLIPNNVTEKQLIEVMYIDIQFNRGPHCFEHKLIVNECDEHVNILIIAIVTKRLQVTMAIPL